MIHLVRCLRAATSAPPQPLATRAPTKPMMHAGFSAPIAFRVTHIRLNRTLAPVPRKSRRPFHFKQGRNLLVIDFNPEKPFDVGKSLIVELDCKIEPAHVLIHHVHIMRARRPR